MALKLEFRSCLLMCTYLLVMPSGRDALSCCRRDFTNGSSSFDLSERPDPSCDTHWSADGIAVVDVSGGVDESRVLHAGFQSIILKGKHTDVIFRMDCDPPKKSVELYCDDLCQTPNEFSPAPEQSQHTRRPKNSANWSTYDGIFIFLSIFIFIFIT